MPISITKKNSKTNLKILREITKQLQPISQSERDRIGKKMIKRVRNKEP